MKHLIVGTAGHIDHGKSALVRALTDIDPDRLKEEKERGLTIDLGFAHFDLPDGTRVGFVDVPGHERFVKNMLAGATGMDIVILVVDATESVMPQTREHLDIMKLLGVSRGIVAITKIDLADPELVEIVEEEIKELVQGSFLESAPIVRLSAKTGEGIEEIRNLIAKAVGEQHERSSEGVFRFPIDRVFTMKGFGTVVTGTVFSGWLAEDEPVLVLPGGLRARARQLQHHNVKQDRISAGMRAAMNLTNLSVQELNRGDTVVRPGTARPDFLLDVRIKLLPSAPRKLPRTSKINLFVATGQRLANMTLIDKPNLVPGDECFAQLRLTQPICVFRGDRFVIRGEAPPYTIGGGIVLDVAPAKIRRKDRAKATAWLAELETMDSAEAALAFLSRRPMGARLQDIAVRTGAPLDRIQSVAERSIEKGDTLSVLAGDDFLVVSRECFDELKRKLLDNLTSFFQSRPHRLFMPREELRSRLGTELAPQLFDRVVENLIGDAKIEATKEGLNLSGRTAQISSEQRAEKEKMENIFLEAAFSPPTFSQAEEHFDDTRSAKKMTSLLIEEGTLQKISPAIAYHREHLEAAIAKIKEHFSNVDKLAVGDLKSLLGISRKHAVPLLEYFDRIGITTRVGDYRILKDKTRG
jgi:selenocysteine-specific elongation factor